MKNPLSKTVAGVTLGLCLTSTSCIGPDNAYNSVKSWNSTVTESKYVNELLFLGMNIVPVYPVCLFGDYILFNSWEFWTGSNPIGAPAEFTPQGEL